MRMWKVRRKKNKKGFTLIEVLVAMGVFATTIVALAVLFVVVATMNESSRNTTRAMADGRLALETIRNTSANGLPVVVATYPHGANMAPALGLNSLQDETAIVTYANPAADPLNVTVQVNWTERGGRVRAAAINTLVTRR